jgi:transposase
LLDALSGSVSPLHRQVLALYLARLELVEAQMGTLEQLIGEAMQAHSEAIARLAELPGLGVDSAQQILAEIGPHQLASWVGVCPGSHESAGESVC